MAGPIARSQKPQATSHKPDDYHRRKAMPAELDAVVIAAWRASGITTPLFRKTSYRRQSGDLRHRRRAGRQPDHWHWIPTDVQPERSAPRQRRVR
jgi:hypothetical protein